MAQLHICMHVITLRSFSSRLSDIYQCRTELNLLMCLLGTQKSLNRCHPMANRSTALARVEVLRTVLFRVAKDEKVSVGKGTRCNHNFIS